MIIKIRTDLFNASRIETVGVSDEDDKVIQVSTFSGSTYEYAYGSVENREKAMAHLESLLKQAFSTSVANVVDPDDES